MTELLGNILFNFFGGGGGEEGYRWLYCRYISGRAVGGGGWGFGGWRGQHKYLSDLL